MRYGRAWHSYDGTEWLNIRMIPIRPKGWIIVINMEIQMGGLPLTRGEAETMVWRLKAAILKKKALNHDNRVTFNEYEVQIREVDPPEGVLIEKIATLDDDPPDPDEWDEAEYAAFFNNSTVVRLLEPEVDERKVV